MDLISRQAAIEALKRAEALTKAFGYHNVIETIRDLPSVQSMTGLYVDGFNDGYKAGKEDAEPEIIRCKDCKWFRKEYGWNCIEYTVCGVSPTHYPIRREEDFCSFAERRSDG